MTIMPQPDVQSVGIQCDLLAAPPLKKLYNTYTYAYSYIIHIYIFTYFNVLTEYAKKLMLKAGEMCLNEQDKPTLPDTPSPLASA